MSQHAAATFDLDTWEEVPYDDQAGAKLTRTRITKTFHGDVEGRSNRGNAHGVRAGSLRRLLRPGADRRHGPRAVRKLRPAALRGLLARGAVHQLVRGAGLGYRQPDGGHTFTLDYELT
jgi:hypothetical protein